MHVLTIKKRRFAVGLWWLTLDKGQDIKTTAAAYASEYNVMAVRKVGDITQVGLSKHDGKGGRIVALAPAVASLVKMGDSNYVGLFALDQGYWLYVLKKGVIAPDGDVFFASKQEAKGHYEDFFQDMAQIHSLEDAEHTETYEETLALFRRYGGLKAKSEIKLEILDPRKRAAGIRKKVLIGAILLGGTLLAGDWWLSYQEQQEMARIQAEASLEQQKRRQAVSQQPAVQAPQPVSVAEAFPDVWNTMPQPSVVIAQCAKQFGVLTPSIHGWEVEGFVCTPTAASVMYKRSQWALFSGAPEGAKTSSDINTRVVDIPFSSMPIRPRQDGLLQQHKMSGAFYDTAILGRLRVDMSQWKIPPSAVPIPKESEPPVSPHRISEWKLSAIGVDLKSFDFLNLIPGVVLEKISYEFASSTWTMQGVLYAKP